MTRRHRPFSSDYVLDLPVVSSPTIRSRDGAITYVKTEVERETLATKSHLELVAFRNGKPQCLTSGPHDTTPHWAPDGKTLAFLRRNGDEATPQLWLLPMTGGEPANLASLPGGVFEYVWSPDSSFIYAVADVDPDVPHPGPDKTPHVREVTELYYRGDTIGWIGKRRRQIFSIRLADGHIIQLTHGDYQHRTLAVSPDGQWLAFASDRSRKRHERAPWGAELCVMPTKGGRVQRLARDVMTLGGIAWRPGNKQIGFIGAPAQNTWQRFVYLLDVHDNRYRRLTDDQIDPQSGFFPISGAPPLTWHRGHLLFCADTQGSSGIYQVTANGVTTPIRSRRELISSLDTTANGKQFAFVVSTTNQPAQIQTFELKSSRSHQVTKVGKPYIEAHALGKIKSFRFRRAGQSIAAWVTYPPNFDHSKQYPLVLEIHGGPNSFHGYGFNPLHQMIAGAGFLVLAVNPRGSTSYGAEFTTHVFEDWGGEDYLDLMKAIDIVCERSYVDSKRLGLHGYSYGGYMASWIIGHNERFRAAVIGAPVTNLVSMYGQTDIAVGFGERQWGGLPHDNLEHYLERSPLSYAECVTTPVLLLHGEDDIRVPISQSEEFFMALKRRGKTVDFVRFPSCSHLFLRTGHAKLRKEYYDRTITWLQRWLMP